jgi:hypothetical protein
MASRTGRITIPSDKALALFNVTSAASISELNASYRRLALKYHPDNNPARTEWAHQVMVRINAAYDSAVEYLGGLRYDEVQARLDREIRAHDDFTALFSVIANRVLDGMFTYYQYGLQNPHQRHSGTPRMRYRQAVRRMSDALGQLEQLRVPNPIDAETLETFRAFARAFLECMQLDRTHNASSSAEEHKAYRRYYEGSRALDAAIRRAFFRTELCSPREPASPQNLAVSHNELMTVVTRFKTTSWVKETAMKLYLVDAFRAVLKISERLPELGL